MIGDLRFALRMLVKAPGFAATAILTLAIGIGANTAIFSVVDAVLLRALPYHNSARLIDIFSTDPNGERDALSTPEFRALQAQMRSLEDIAGFQSQSVNVTGGERPDRVRGSFVSANFFRVFNLTPLLGRILRQGVTLVVVGSTFGLIAAVALTRLISHLLVGVSPTDPLTLTAM